ncbi:unnamed protein product [Closterium sp. NIES-54]
MRRSKAECAGPAPSGVSQVDPPPLVEPLEISSDSSGPAEGGDPATDDTAATRRSPRLETPPGFPPRPSSPPPQPASVDSGAETAGAEPGGAETEGEGSGGAATGGAGSGGDATRGADSGGADSGGATIPSGSGAVGDLVGGPGAGQPSQPDLLEMLSPQQIRAWIVRRGSSGGGGFGPAGAGAASPVGTAGGAGGAAGAGGTAGGSAGVGGTRGAGGAGGATGARGAGGATGARGAGGAGAASAGGAAGARGTGGTAGGAGAASAGGVASARGAGAASAGGTAGAGGIGGTAGGAGAASAGGATRAGGAGAASAGGAAGAGGTGVAAGARGAGPAGALRHLLGLPPAPTEFLVAGTTPPLLFQRADLSQPQLLPHSPLPTPTPYTVMTESLTERREPKSRASTPERQEHETRASVLARVCRVHRPRAPAVPGTHDMTLRPSSVPQCVVLPSPPASSLPDIADPPSDLARASSPTVTRLLATVVTDPMFSSPAPSALVTELVDFAAALRLDYLTSLVSDPDPACPPFVEGEVALGCDVLEDRHEKQDCLAGAAPHLATMLLTPEGDPDALDIPTPRSYREAILGEYSSQWQTAMDAEMASWKSTGSYVDKVPPPGANIVSDIWIFRVNRPQGSPPAFKARYVARAFRQHERVDFFLTLSPTLKMTTLRVLLHVAAQRDYELHSLDFSTAFLQGSLHEAIWLRCPPGFTGSFPEDTQWSMLETKDRVYED